MLVLSSKFSHASALPRSTLHNPFPIAADVGSFAEHRGEPARIFAVTRGWSRASLCARPHGLPRERSLCWKAPASCPKRKSLTLAKSFHHLAAKLTVSLFPFLLPYTTLLLQLLIHWVQNHHCVQMSLKLWRMPLLIPHPHQNTGHGSSTQSTAPLLPRVMLIKSEKAILIHSPLLWDMGFERILERCVEIERSLRRRWGGLSDGGAWTSSTWSLLRSRSK